MGSEPGMAWNWCAHLAKYCELHIITEGEFRHKIETLLPTLPHGSNMHFYYNPVSEEIRKMCWNQGDWRFYGHYRKWQYKTYEIAKEIVKKEKIDIIHQLNMIGFREPGYLWKIEGIPFVWGPLDAKEKFPTSYLKGASIKTKAFIHLKNVITKLQLCYSSRVREAMKKAAVVISASSTSQEAIEKYFKISSPLINETGCYIQENLYKKKYYIGEFNVVWVGKLDFRKQLALAIYSLALTKNYKIKLHIIGAGDKTKYLKLADSLRVAEQCIWYGAIDYQEVQEIMRNSDLFFFTSVAEGTPHVVLEAMSNNLPILCFDTCGQGDIVNDEIGVKIKLSTSNQSIREFSSYLNYLCSNPELLKQMSNNCKKRQAELSWDTKAVSMLTIYQNYIQ